MPLQQTDAVEVRRTRDRGRGVFARRPIPEGAVIERVPVLVLPAALLAPGGRRARLADYCFVWGRRTVALALGFGSLYNHSRRPNACCDDQAPETKVYRALRDIAQGEEITINYNGEPDDPGDVGFTVMEP